MSLHHHWSDWYGGNRLRGNYCDVIYSACDRTPSLLLPECSRKNEVQSSKTESWWNFLFYFTFFACLYFVLSVVFLRHPPPHPPGIWLRFVRVLDIVILSKSDANYTKMNISWAYTGIKARIECIFLYNIFCRFYRPNSRRTRRETI